MTIAGAGQVMVCDSQSPGMQGGIKTQACAAQVLPAAEHDRQPRCLTAFLSTVTVSPGP